MSHVCDAVFLLAGAVLLCIMVYLVFLAAASLAPPRTRSARGDRLTRFAIVVPAHDEERMIGTTLANLASLDYPADLCEVFVIADNCSDGTAEMAARHGVTCWERKDDERKGKGFALQWAFARLLREVDHDAFVIVDADSVLDPRFLRFMSQRVQEGARAIQGYYDILSPEKSVIGSLTYLGFVLSRKLRYQGRTRLGWSSNLLGNGMCFTREIIQRFGWCSTSIVEDIECGMILRLNGVRVDFAPEAKVCSEFPDTFGKSKTQRGRWDIGKLRVARKYFLRLVREGLARGDLSYLDGAMELAIPPFSIYVAMAVAGAGLFFALDFKGFNINGVLWASLVALLALYVLLGLLLARSSWRIYAKLLYAPFFIMWRVWLVGYGLLMGEHDSWVKTERN